MKTEDQISNLDSAINQVICGDCLEIMKKLPDNSVDLCLTDPPYGYSFMGKDWDKAVPSVDIWKECLRVLKAGAFAFVMSAPRQDVLARMIVNLESAGFRTDFTSIYWTYATGFPKAQNIGKAVDKKLGVEREVIGTREQHDIRNNSYCSKKTSFTEKIKGGAVSKEAKALEGSYGGFQPKPAVEIIIVVMKPLEEKTFVAQAMKNKKGVTWLDDCRIPYKGEVPNVGGRGKHGRGKGYGFKPLGETKAKTDGRFPANILVSDNVLSAESKGAAAPVKSGQKGFGGKIYNKYKTGGDDGKSFHSNEEESKSLSRFFDLDSWNEEAKKTFPFLVIPKASKSEKNEWCEENNHPTVKPLKLMRYLITLGSREKDIVIDPFLGSGTTARACKDLGRRFIGIEISKKYCEIAEERLKQQNLF